MRRTARAAQAGVDERESKRCKRHKRNEDNTENETRFGECRRGGHPCSPRRTRWERTRSPRPIASTATPAAINAPRNGAVPRRAMVAVIKSQPATSISKPASFMDEPSPQRVSDVSANNSVKSMNSAWTFNGPMGTRGKMRNRQLKPRAGGCASPINVFYSS